jgi:probable addiction module antidote protein
VDHLEREIRLYRTGDGRVPFSEWFDSLDDVRTQQRIDALSAEQKMKTVSYKEGLLKRLVDVDYAAGYLTECLEQGEAEFLLALRDVVEAQGGIGQLAKAAKLNRESLYKLLSERGNPRLSSLASILDGLGIELQFVPKAEAA